MVYRQLGFREARKHPGRAILTLASVAIGVAAVVAVTFTTNSTQNAFDQIFRSLAGRANLEIAAPIGESISASLANEVAEISGVEAVAPRLQRPTVLFAGDERVQLFAAAIDTERDQDIHNYKIVAGNNLSQGAEVLLDQLLAENLNVKVDDQIFLLTRSGRIRAKVVGLFASPVSAVAGQGAGLLLPLRQGQQWCRAPQRLYVIQIVIDPEADEASVRTSIEELLPENALLRNPAGRSALAEETVFATNQALIMARAFIVLVAVFVITNTFLISVTQRRRQLGILRALGGTRGQIAALVMSEATAMGVGGTLLGSLLGVTIARYLNQAMGAIYETAMPPIELTWPPFLWAALFGIGMSLAGAAIPAFKAAHLSPLEALRDVLPEEIEGAARWFPILGVVTVIVCGTLLFMSITGRLAQDVAIYSGVMGLVGLVLILPLALPAITRAVGKLLPSWMQVEGRIAGRQLLIHRTRTTLTVGVVFIAASAAIGLANTVLDNVQDIKDWYRKTLIADFYIRATMPDMATGMAADLPDGLDQQLLAVEGVLAIDALRMVSAKIGDHDAVLIVRSYEDEEMQQFDVVFGDENTIRERLAAGEIVIGSVLGQRADLSVGNDLPLATDEGTKTFRIAAIVNDYQAGGMTAYIDRETAERELEVGGVDVYVVKADHDRLEHVRAELLEVARGHGLILQSFSELQGEIENMMSGVDAGLWGMVALGLLIATFGVVNTLMISVLQQAFEFGLLRVVGRFEK